jgi:hypothetical protein
MMGEGDVGSLLTVLVAVLGVVGVVGAVVGELDVVGALEVVGGTGWELGGGGELAGGVVDFATVLDELGVGVDRRDVVSATDEVGAPLTVAAFVGGAGEVVAPILPDALLGAVISDGVPLTGTGESCPDGERRVIVAKAKAQPATTTTAAMAGATARRFQLNARSAASAPLAGAAMMNGPMGGCVAGRGAAFAGRYPASRDVIRGLNEPRIRTR